MSRDGMNYQPAPTVARPVVEPGSFAFAAAFFDHGHIYAQISGLADAGTWLKYIYEPDAARYQKDSRRPPARENRPLLRRNSG